MKGHILITLGSKIHFSDLELLAEEVKMKLMYDAKNLFVFYYLKHDVNKNHIWALSHFRELKTDIQISGLTIDEEHFLLKKMESDNRLVIGHWLDDINLNALITIFEEENETVFIETLFKDGSSMIQEQIVTKLNQGTKYIDIDYVHNEYILVDDNGVMFFYSETGIFNQLGKM